MQEANWASWGAGISPPRQCLLVGFCNYGKLSGGGGGGLSGQLQPVGGSSCLEEGVWAAGSSAASLGWLQAVSSDIPEMSGKNEFSCLGNGPKDSCLMLGPGGDQRRQRRASEIVEIVSAGLTSLGCCCCF